MLVQIYENFKLAENFRGWHGQKYVWPVMWWDSKFDFISEMNRWNGVGQKWEWLF